MRPEPVPGPEKYKAVLIGLGNIAWKYDSARDISTPAQSQGGAMRKRGDMVLAGGCSPDPADRNGFAAWAPGVKVYARAEEMLAEQRPDLAGLCSPAAEHFAQARLCLEAGVKALWLEKPPADTPDQLRELAARAREKGAAVCVNYTRRYLPLYAELRRFLREKMYGDCRLLRLLYSPGLARNGIHLLDQLFYLTGAGGYELLWVEKGDPDNPAFALRLSTGHLVQGSGGNWPYHTNDLELVCEGGVVSALRGGKFGRAEKRVENDLFPGFHDLKDDPAGLRVPMVFGGHMEAALEDLTACLNNSGQPRSNLESAQPAQRLLDDILRGARP